MPAIIKPSRLACLTQTEAVSGGGLTTVSAFLLFDFSMPRKLLAEQALWPMVVEQMPRGAIFDKGRLKPKSEVIIAGSALSPTDQPVAGCRVTAQLGAMQKRLAVFGDRFWRLTDQGIQMLDARPFHEMPIDEAHAFGGSGHKLNPHGKGFGARQIAEAGYDAPLPNVENAGALIKSVDDTPLPTHFGPIAPDSPFRMKYAGTYDSHWLSKVAPLKPEDFNPLFNCDAPEDQQFADYFGGSEAFGVSGMSRGATSVQGQLPGINIRAFVHRPADNSFTEIRMVCETVTLFPNITKATIAFRGITKGEDRFGEDIGTVMLAAEHAEAQPRPAEYYLEVFRLRTDPQEGFKHALSEFQLMPALDQVEVSARRAAKLEKARRQRVVSAENQTWGIRKMMEAEGISPDLVPDRNTDGIDELPLVAMPTTEEIENGELDIAELIDDVKTLEQALLHRADEEFAKMELQRRALVTAAPKGMLPAFLEKPVVDAAHMERFPDIAIDAGFQEAMDGLENALGNRSRLFDNFDAEFAGEPMSGMPGEMDRIFETIETGQKPANTDAAEKQFRQACARVLKQPEGSIFHDIRTALGDISLDALAPGLESAAGGEDPLQDEISQAIASVANQKLQASNGAAFDPEAFLAHDLEIDRDDARQQLAKVGEIVRKAAPNLIAEGYEDNPVAGLLSKLQTIAPPADPADADLTIGEKLEKEQIAARTRLDVAEAEMNVAIGTGRQMSPVALFPVEPLLPGIADRLGAFAAARLAENADLKGGDLAGANLRGLDFSGLDLGGTFFERADLTGANFSGANLKGAAFTGAILDEADLTGADLTGANFSEASVKDARLDRVRIADCTIMKANFSGASARNASISSVTVIDCNWDRLDLRESDIAKLQMVQGQADGIRFDGARIFEAAFLLLSMKAASLENANLERVAFTEIRSPGAVFTGAKMQNCGFMGNCDMTGGNFERIVASQVAWNNTKLSEACFVRARCDSCLFNGCDMSACDLRVASMRKCIFTKSVLADSDMFGANLFAASLAQSDLRRTSMRGANLYFADLTDAKLASCDLSGANLGKTLLEQPYHA